MEDVDVDANEEQFLRQVLETKRYDLLRKRTDYLQRQLSLHKDLIYELYLGALLKNEEEIVTFIRNRCNVTNYDLFELAVRRNVKLSDLNTYWTPSEKIGYYSVVLEEDCLELFLEQQGELTYLLNEECVYQLLVKSTSSRIIHHLCKKGEYEPIIMEYLVRSLRSWNGLREKELELLSSICDQYASTEFLTTRFITHVSHFNMHLCKLLLRLGARPSAEQKQELLLRAPSFHRELFGEDV